MSATTTTTIHVPDTYTTMETTLGGHLVRPMTVGVLVDRHDTSGGQYRAPTVRYDLQLTLRFVDKEAERVLDALSEVLGKEVAK